MKKKSLKKLAAAVLTASMVLSLAACGSSETGAGAANQSQSQTAAASTAGTQGSTAGEVISEDSPYYGMGYDLSEQVNVVMYVLGDRPADMDEVLEKANNEYFIPNLNSTLQIEFLNWSDYTTKYALVLAGGEQVDLMYTASWCYYNEEAAKGAFKLLDMDFIEQYMPYTYAEQPSESWDQISISGSIYAVPKAKASFTAYNIIAVRQDLIDQYNLTTPDSWDNYKTYLSELAQLKSQTGVTPLGTNANREQLQSTFLQTKGVMGAAEGYDWYYYHNDKEDAPAAEDIFYYYTSDLYKEYCMEMAELVELGAWSTDAINDTTDAQAYFENGTSGSFVWNTTVFQAGQNLESSGIGTYAVYDVTPDALRSRGSYATDATAIATKSEHPERAALVLDYMKSDVNLNRLLLGGIEGVHYELDADGYRTTLDKASDYGWNNWGWAINRADEPDEAGLDERQIAIAEHCDEMEFHPVTAGFTFDPSGVETQYMVVKAIVDEYKNSFALGIYGDDTEATFEKFKADLEKAGIDAVTEEFLNQYKEFLSRKGL